MPEPDGIELPSLTEARDEAARAARDIWLDGRRKGEDRTDWTAEIRDDADTVLARVSFRDALEE